MATRQIAVGAGEVVGDNKKGDHMAEESPESAKEQIKYDNPYGAAGVAAQIAISPEAARELSVERQWTVHEDSGPFPCGGTVWQPTWFDVGPVKFAAFGDRLLIEEDEFRSGYECQACGGTGKRECTECGGEGHYTRRGTEFKCSHCTNGKVTCIECGGKGGLIVVPEVSQRRPSTGKVVSVGDKVSNNFHVGDNVLYSNFAGHTVDLERAGFKVVLRILHETEILAQVKGHLELRQLRNEREALGI